MSIYLRNYDHFGISMIGLYMQHVSSKNVEELSKIESQTFFNIFTCIIFYSQYYYYNIQSIFTTLKYFFR